MGHKNILSSLIGNSAFRDYTDMLRAELAATDKLLRTASGDVLMRLQGKAQALTELIGKIERANKGNQ